jgi:MarR family transcriptional regulator, organic hydroperoxide resistance regulator
MQSEFRYRPTRGRPGIDSGMAYGRLMTKAFPTLALDDQLCFALYAASRAMTARYRRLLDDLGLTYPQYLVMLVLWEERRCSVSRIGQRLRLDSGTLSPLLKRLETAGLVHRERDAHDERSVVIGLTRAGQGLRRRAGRVPERLAASVRIDHAAAARLVADLHELSAALAGEV